MDRKMMAASTSMLLLKLLEEEDLYGYQMIRRLEARSDNVFCLKEGTMYPAVSYTHLYVLTKLGDDYSTGLGHYFTEAFEALGGEVVSDTFQEGNSDFTSYITSAKNEGAEVFLSLIHIWCEAPPFTTQNFRRT